MNVVFVFYHQQKQLNKTMKPFNHFSTSYTYKSSGNGRNYVYLTGMVSICDLNRDLHIKQCLQKTRKLTAIFFTAKKETDRPSYKGNWDELMRGCMISPDFGGFVN